MNHQQTRCDRHFGPFWFAPASVASLLPLKNWLHRLHRYRGPTYAQVRCARAKTNALRNLSVHLWNLNVPQYHSSYSKEMFSISGIQRDDSLLFRWYEAFGNDRPINKNAWSKLRLNLDLNLDSLICWYHQNGILVFCFYFILFSHFSSADWQGDRDLLETLRTFWRTLIYSLFTHVRLCFPTATLTAEDTTSMRLYTIL